MAVRIHFRAERGAAVTDDEVAAARDLLSAHAADLPYDAEALTVEERENGTLEGAAALPGQDPFTSVLALAHWCRALTDVRRALPGTTAWQVEVDGEAVPWDEQLGFGWPEQHDPAALQLMEEMRAATVGTTAD